MSLHIYIGKNNVGKTTILKGLKTRKRRSIWEEHNNDDEITLSLSSNFDKENILWHTGSRQHPYEDVARLLRFLTRVPNIPPDKLKEIKDSKEMNHYKRKLSIFWENVKKEFQKDIFLEEVFLKAINLEEEEKWNKESKHFDIYFFHHETQNDEFPELQSGGVVQYSIIKLFNEVVRFAIENNSNLKEPNKIKVIIDEPENNCHPELIFKIAQLIFDISSKINTYISTHSSLLLQKLYNLDYATQKNTEYVFVFDKGKTLNLDLQKKLTGSNSRRRKIILESLFGSNVIFCEGLSDEIFLDDLIFNNMNEISDKHISIFDANSKGEVEKCGQILHDLQLLKHINVYLFYDLDPNKNKKYPNGQKIIIPDLKSIYFDPDLEKTFYLEDKTTTDKFLTKKGQTEKKNLSLKINDILKDSTKPKSDILKLIKHYKNEIKNWVK